MLLRACLLLSLPLVCRADGGHQGCRDELCDVDAQDLLEKSFFEVDSSAPVSFLQESRHLSWAFGRRDLGVAATRIWPREDTHDVYFSEKNWKVTGSGATAVNPGAYFKVTFTKSKAAELLLEPTGWKGEYMTLAWNIDDAPLQTTRIAGDTESVMLARHLNDTIQHTLRVEIYNAVEDPSDRFAAYPKTGLHLKAIMLDDGAVTSPAPLAKKRALFYGDSITEGSRAECSEPGRTDAALDTNAASKTWVTPVASVFDAEYSQVAFYSQGWTVPGKGGVPPFYTSFPTYVDSTSAWNKVFAGAERSFENLDYIFVLHGTNDGLVAELQLGFGDQMVYKSVTGFLTDIRKAAGPATHVFLIVPFGSFGAKRHPEGVLRRAFDSYQNTASDNHTHFLDLGEDAAEGLLDWDDDGTVYACDGIHPTGGAHGWPARQQELGALVAAKALEALHGGA
eukprot:TRINITY_DN115210_c0_g1_i1.p1 TRINITY_DN115210_c0_g1~~TRINITY_DN115210_c0_g1_i1.p1  ORF type:complete len:452 (+),score=59.90 TRINITY_DN115210_c0_g1_i1:53-1408(+)